MIKIRRVYDKPGPDEGSRFLIDRLWPRGKRKEDLDMVAWLKEASPSNELRKWYVHDPAKWDEFRRRYFAELEAHPEAWQPILDAARHGNVTLLYSTRETNLSNAAALRQFLEQKVEAPADR